MIKRFDLNKANLNPNFIGSWMIQTELCNDLIEYFEKSQRNQKEGVTSSGLINHEIKNRIDISISPRELEEDNNKIFKKYFEQLFECYKDYHLQWPFVERIAKNLEIGSFNLGRYLPGQHFQSMHTERSSLSTLHRLFAFMTYLNDVKEGGSTYFNHYDLTIEPQKGLTIIWPAEWTHAHQGNKLIKGTKYIITGWLNFPIKSF
tara:strand:+ start:463 stop:1074 length:612 start_codon:yes stop_codon:yes gene_type:complete